MSEELEAREIAAEQQYVDEVYVQLEASTQSAMALAQEGRNRGRLEHEGGLVERDAMVFQAAKRIAQPFEHETCIADDADGDGLVSPDRRRVDVDLDNGLGQLRAP